MAKFIDKCLHCGKDFENYHAAYRRFCSVGCNAEWALESQELNQPKETD